MAEAGAARRFVYVRSGNAFFRLSPTNWRESVRRSLLAGYSLRLLGAKRLANPPARNVRVHEPAGWDAKRWDREARRLGVLASVLTERAPSRHDRAWSNGHWTKRAWVDGTGAA